jgi:hypothetical protein
MKPGPRQLYERCTGCEQRSAVSQSVAEYRCQLDRFGDRARPRDREDRGSIDCAGCGSGLSLGAGRCPAADDARDAALD